MPNVVEEIPAELRPATDAALAWINREKGSQFRLTGLVDPEEAIARGAGQPIELGLVICEGEICLREQIRVEPTAEGFTVSAAEAETSLILPFLDPPPGVRENWLDYGHLRRRPWASHPKGYFQPGVVALSRAGRVLYRWRCRPMRQNMSGAGQRPTPQYVWGEIESRLPAGIPDAELDESPEFARPDPSWPMFLTMMLAHGWFLRPKAFPLARPGDKPSANVRRMKTTRCRFRGGMDRRTGAPADRVGGARPSGLGGYRVARSGGLYRQFQHIPHAEPKIHGP